MHSGVGGGGASAPQRALICCKSGQKWCPTLFDLKKWRPTFAEKHKNARRPYFFEVIPYKGLQVAQNFSGKFGEIQAKILRTPKNLHVPYTYVPYTPVRRFGWQSFSTPSHCKLSVALIFCSCHFRMH